MLDSRISMRDKEIKNFGNILFLFLRVSVFERKVLVFSILDAGCLHGIIVNREGGSRTATTMITAARHQGNFVAS